MNHYFNYIIDLIKSWFYPPTETLDFFGTVETGLRTERDYQLKCNEVLQGKIEHRLQDATRVDILTDDLAIEVDSAKNWYEAVGQSVHYAKMTKKKPAVLLIVRRPEEEKYVKAAIEACNITQVNGYYIVVLIYRDIK